MANVGDSRCVLCRSGVAIDMSVDHKPDDDKELKRIQNAGGKVTAEGRVNGGLNLSRAMGKSFDMISVRKIEICHQQRHGGGCGNTPLPPPPSLQTSSVN